MHATCSGLLSTRLERCHNMQSSAWALRFSHMPVASERGSGLGFSSLWPPGPEALWFPLGRRREKSKLGKKAWGRGHSGQVGWHPWLPHTLLFVLCFNNGKWLFSAFPVCSALSSPQPAAYTQRPRLPVLFNEEAKMPKSWPCCCSASPNSRTKYT